MLCDLGRFGYPSLRIHLIATLPSTVIAAAQKLNLHAVIVAMAMYSLLIIDFFALVALGGEVTPACGDEARRSCDGLVTTIVFFRQSWAE